MRTPARAWSHPRFEVLSARHPRSRVASALFGGGGGQLRALASNTNTCPPGSSKIASEAACASAAAATGRSLAGTMKIAATPSGCYYVVNVYVIFNDDPTGAPHPDVQPLCAGAP